ncbi:hypothetical protein CO2235_MP80498 [Cupriavidus oxalaticus]|uniref:Uncharacterized protein n=1 Tax=Cupriavidus oxalaticus TaxID=96344 RepID=A0A976GDT3_9BURK|nr:hypothetical protein CO2235_MP80498 [Cupriavidus oxalaticus]
MLFPYAAVAAQSLRIGPGTVYSYSLKPFHPSVRRYTRRPRSGPSPSAGPCLRCRRARVVRLHCQGR